MMHIQNQIVTIFGGTGFLGSCVVQEAAKAGFMVRVAVRHPDEGLSLKQMGEVGQIQLIQASVLDSESLNKALAGATYVVNCVGILAETREQKFSTIHVDAPRKIAELAAAKNLKRLIHVSSLGANPQASSQYLKTKGEGEQALFQAFPRAVVVRPSVLFGVKDNFICRFVEMALSLKVVPLIGGGRTKLQPVYVNDVAKGMVSLLTMPDLPKTAEPLIFELGGPQVFSFRNLIQTVLEAINCRALFVTIPFPLAQLGAALIQLFSNRILTVDQVKMLKLDNILTNKYPGFKELKLTPCSLEDQLPSFVARFLNLQRTHPFSTFS